MAPIALTVGEALIDEYVDRRVVAGAPLHVAAHLAALGWHAALVTRVGADDDGQRVRDTAADLGIDTTMIETDASLPTGHVTVGLDTAGVPGFTVHGPAAWDAVEGPDPVPRHDVLLFGSLPMRDARSRSTILRLVGASTGLIAVDANLRAPDYDEETIGSIVDMCGLLKLSEEELPIVASAIGTEASGEALLTAGMTWVCITRGERGASLHHRDGGSWHHAGFPVPVVDTVGAGDAFLAALLDGLVRDEDPESTLERAAWLASDVVGRRGGLPETSA